ncbi:hypothetical protein PV762_00765 [Mitsuaria sp. CC2]|uniref:hypothetical protein n=1 Tax=Mitsuaria sp. CC2 TaxID=3029186 RepID=UPI003B8BBCF4
MESNHRHERETYAIFASPDDYAYHIGQVVSIGDDGLRVLRKQLSIKTPYRIDVVPTERVSHAVYDARLAPMRIVAGVIVLLLLAGVLFGLSVYWNDLQPGTHIQIGMLALAGGYGLRWAFMSRQHRLTFQLHDGTRLRWFSRSGDFKYKTGSVHRGIERLTELGLLRPPPTAR